MTKALSTSILLLSLFIYSPSASANEKTFNLDFNPLGLVIGITNASLLYAINDRHQIGFTAAAIDVDLLNVKQTGSQYGIKYRYAFNKAFEDSWIITVEAGKLSTELTTQECIFTCSETTGDADASYTSVLWGYLWAGDLFTSALSIGAVNYKADVTVNNGTGPLSSPLNGTDVGLDFSIGIKF
jgi:hypothetical protein